MSFEILSQMGKDDDADERIVATKQLKGDAAEETLRPTRLEDYFGQNQVKANIKIAIEAARKRGDALDHVLLYGPPGLGKTTLAGIIAHEMGVDMKITSGPAIERQGDLAAILTNLKEKDILFIDEIHRLNRTVEEMIYPAMEDFGLDIIIGKGPAARTIRLDLPHFTLIGATTKAGMISSPLRDRFGIIHRLELYSPAEISDIIKRNAGILQVDIEDDVLAMVSKRCRGTPRVAIRLLRRLRDYAQVKGDNIIDEKVCQTALQALRIDDIGLDETDRRMLRAIAEMYGGGPVGLETLSASTGEDPGTIEDVYEPYLMQIGFLVKTPRGRMLTDKALQHLNIKLEKMKNRPENYPAQISFFDKLPDAGEEQGAE